MEKELVGNINLLRLKSFPLDNDSLSFINEIKSVSGIEKIVILPDAYTKQKYLNKKYKITIPSSTAISTHKQYFYPQFRSRGINCGMMVVALPILREELNEKFTSELLKSISYSLSYYVGYRLRLPVGDRSSDLTVSDFVKVLEGGALALAKLKDLDPSNLGAMEVGGTAQHIDLNAAKKYLNPDWFKLSAVRLRHSFGTYFGGNHFLEIQEVSDFVPGHFNVKKNQLVIMLHGGCESVESLLRPDLVKKYIKQKRFVSIPEGHEMREAFFAAQKVIVNYTSAYRLNTFAIVNQVVKQVFGNNKHATVLLERGHNSVQLEKDGFIYRHNAERIMPDGYTILSGSRVHPSYVLSGGNKTDYFLNSIDHGLGKILDNLNHLNHPGAEKVTLYNLKKGIRAPLLKRRIEQPVVYNDSAQQYLDLIERAGLAHKILTLRPVVNVKFVK